MFEKRKGEEKVSNLEVKYLFLLKTGIFLSFTCHTVTTSTTLGVNIITSTINIKQ